jgi:hypothetical protein
MRGKSGVGSAQGADHQWRRLEGRGFAMRDAGVTSPFGAGYSRCFNDWLIFNRFDLGPEHRAKLLVVMGLLPEIEQWRATLTAAPRLRLNSPGAVLHNYRKATRVRIPEHVTSPTAPAPA